MNDRLTAVLRIAKKGATGEHVIADEKGNPLLSVKRAFQSVRKRAGLLDLRIHDLRHTFATRLIECGVPDRIVQEPLGHSTPGVTVRYTHPNGEALRRAVESLERPLSRPIQNTQADRKLFRRVEVEQVYATTASV